MAILVGFAPYIVFALLTRFAPASLSLLGAALFSAALVLREKIYRRSMKILEAGTVVLFALLGLYASFTHAALNIPAVRSVVDGGLFLIITLSLFVERPFTLQYAREQVPAEIQTSPAFVKANYVITSLWAGAMAVVVGADLTMYFVPGVPLWLEIAAIICALGGAFWFTNWYPEHRQKASKRF
jgi:hypothetical protein